MTPACQFFAGYRELLVTVNYRVWRPGTGQSCLRQIWLQRILRPVSGLGDMTVFQATARQPSLITPLNSLLSVLNLTEEIIDFTLKNTDLNNQHVTEKRQTTGLTEDGNEITGQSDPLTSEYPGYRETLSRALHCIS